MVSDLVPQAPPNQPLVEVREQPPAPREPEEKPWEHPSDGGEPLDGHALWINNAAFGTFETSEEFPDALAQALRRVFETMHRSGFRDWELDGDYVECSYWFLRRSLEIVAREAFRLWYGEGTWQEPFRLACHRQEAGEVEYRIDHLLSTELGVEIRKREEPHPEREAECTPRKRGPNHGELSWDLRSRAQEIMAPGEFLDPAEIARRLGEHVEYEVRPISLLYTLDHHPELFVKEPRPGTKGHARYHYALHPSEPS